MKTKNNINLKFLIFLVNFLFLFTITDCTKKNSTPPFLLVQPKIGSIKIFVSASGTVLPRNRLEVKSSLAGRVEKVLVSEGQYVHAGQTLAYMSSSERAALLDAARSQGSENLHYWEQVYKPILIVSPMDGTVIVRNIEPGQTVSSSDTMFVISDRLVIQALLDETDIGKVKTRMRANITLDAYPDTKIKGVVEHISFESTVNNNVTMYKVKIMPKQIPSFVRSGMNASVEIISQEHKNIITLPNELIRNGQRGTGVLLKENGHLKFKLIKIGISDGFSTEILNGLSTNDMVISQQKSYKTTGKKNKNQTQNPFFPKPPPHRRGRSPH